MNVNFTKFHGLGNDYLVIEADQLGDVSDLGDFARRICDRHYGAGGDGIAVIGEPRDPAANFNVRIFNPDGSEAGLSGNGTRCAVAHLYYYEKWKAEELRLSTRTGLKTYFLRQRVSPGKFIFQSELGKPKLDPPSIPMNAEGIDRVIGYPLQVGDRTVTVTALQVGNPHCCIFVNDFSELDWRALGPLIENHSQFPNRTNVVFVKVLNRRQIELRIWERGVGVTSASGTCSCAGAVASMVNDKTDRDIRVTMQGGEVSIVWREDEEVVITGSAEVVYKGEWLGQQ